MRLGCGFRQPNSETEFGASVMGIGPYGETGKLPRPPGPATQSGAFAVRSQGMGGNRGRDHPQRGHQPRTIPQSPSGRQLPLHKGAFGDGGCGLPRRFAPRNDSPDPLSFRGGPTGRRGNPSFLRWTGVRAAEIVGPYGKKGKLPRPPGQRLAKRKARKEQLVKFDFCPMTSECSTAHNARRFQQSSARAPVGTAITEQDRLAPHPAARLGAPRP